MKRMKNELHPSSGKDLLTLCPAEYQFKQNNWASSTDSQNNGTSCHALVFGGKKAEVMPFDSIRSNAAKEWWEAAEKRGVVPIKKADKLVHIKNAADQARLSILGRFGCLPTAPTNDCEVPIEWESPEGTPCKGSPDCVLVFAQEVIILDLKTWDTPHTFARNIVGCGYHIQIAAYAQAVALKYPGKRIRYCFLAQSLKAPYCNLFVWPTDDAADYGRKKWGEVCEVYKSLTDGGFWDCGYEDQKYDLTAWQRAELERE